MQYDTNEVQGLESIQNWGYQKCLQNHFSGLPFFENLSFEPLALVEEKMYEIFLFNFLIYGGSLLAQFQLNSTIPDLTHLKIVVNRTNFLIYLDFSKSKQEILEENSKKKLYLKRNWKVTSNKLINVPAKSGQTSSAYDQNLGLGPLAVRNRNWFWE